MKIGTRFIDRFQTQQILKEYDLSISYLVLDEKKHEARVLRELFPSNPSSRSLLLKFDQAARTLINLAPPQLVPVFEHFTKDRRFYTVEKHPTGISTRDKAATGKPLPKEQARSIFEQLLQAIKQLHNLNPSLYHGHLDAGQVFVSDDWQLMFLTDPGYLLDSVQEGETPSVPALLAKDLRDTALLVLELVSGTPAEKLQANKGLISETVKGLENLYLASALEWILAGKEEKPASLEGLELLGNIIDDAEGRQESCDEDARREILNKAYNLCGASCICTALDKLTDKKPTQPIKESPADSIGVPTRVESPQTSPTSKPRQSPAAPVVSHPAKRAVESRQPAAIPVESLPVPPIAKAQQPESAAPSSQKKWVFAVILVTAALLLVIIFTRESSNPIGEKPPPPQEYGNLKIDLDLPANASLDGWDLPEGGQHLASTHLFKNVRPGTHTLDVWKGDTRKSLPVTITGGKTAEYKVVLRR